MKLATVTRKIESLQLNEKVYQCDPSTPIHDAIEVMKKQNIGSIVVTERASILVIFTERDYVQKIAGRESERWSEAISNHMTENPICVKQEEPIATAILQMRLGQFRHIVVTDEANQLVGVLSVKDILDFLVDED